MPAELTSLTELNLGYNQLTSVPAEIGQTSGTLTSMPAEIGQLSLQRQSADELAGGDRAAHVAGEVGAQRESADEHAGGDWAARPRENLLTSVPAEIGQLTLLTELYLNGNQLTSVPAEIGQITSLEKLGLVAIS